MGVWVTMSGIGTALAVRDFAAGHPRHPPGRNPELTHGPLIDGQSLISCLLETDAQCPIRLGQS